MPSAVVLDPRRPARTSRPGHLRAFTDTCYPTELGDARVLARFDSDAGPREVLAIRRADASALVLDCRPGGLRDARVVGRIAREEPAENATLLARMYAADERRGRPRALSSEDLQPGARPVETDPESGRSTPALQDAEGRRYALALVSEGSTPELRWSRRSPRGRSGPAHTLSLRATVGALESYEPVPITELALATATTPLETRTLRGELERMRRSPIVLNRGLCEAVARRLAEGASLSEIALRCGRLKHDRRGNASGETSWLARRIGQLPEGGQERPTPWIHSDTLALIAREGLCMSPHEVEL